MTNGRARCGATASATLEFAYIRPDSPVTLTGPRRSTLDGGVHCHRSQSCFSNPFLQLEEQQKLLQRQRRHQSPFVLHELRGTLPSDDDPRPSSIYGQPSLTVEKAAYSVQPPDVVPNHRQPSASKLMKRAVKAYTHSKSDSSFVLKASPSQLQGHLAVT